MDELKEIVGLIAQLPTLAIWIFLGFFAYKTIIVGSIYGTIRFVVEKVYLVFKQEVSKQELNLIISNHEQEISRWKSNYSLAKEELAEAKAETERVLHMYKILKEVKVE